jgi:hypothetical protein
LALVEAAKAACWAGFPGTWLSDEVRSISLSRRRQTVLDGHPDGPGDREVIDRDLLQALAILAKANGRSVVEEINIAVSSYVSEELPLKLGKAGMALLLEDLSEAEPARHGRSPSQSQGSFRPAVERSPRDLGTQYRSAG